MSRIKIVGGGWYGCHLALGLLSDGHKVKLYERSPALFAGASGANQSRLHLGFHYPRSAVTRRDAIVDFELFMQHYGFLTQEVPCNIYAIAEDKSLIDYDTYKQIMSASGLSFLELREGDHGLTGLEGALVTGERLIMQNAARDFFTEKIGKNVLYNCDTHTGRDPLTTDFVINCTYGGLLTPRAARYEPCLLFIYNGPQTFAVTVMDGPFGISLYPYFAPGKISLTSVEHTPLGRYASYREAQAAIDSPDFEEHVLRNRRAMEARINEYVPWFSHTYTYDSYAVSIRALPSSAADRRTAHVFKEDKIISVLPGKIGGIFETLGEIRGLI